MAERRGRGGVRHVVLPPSLLALGRIDYFSYNDQATEVPTPPEETPTPDPDAPVASSITLSPVDVGIIVGASTQLTATVNDQFGNDMHLTASWTTSDPSVATVTAQGLVTGVSAGVATVTAYYGAVVSSSSTRVAVSNPAITQVTVSPTSLSLTEGGATTTLTATTRDAQGNSWTNRVVTWVSHDTNVATVTASGYTVTVTPIGDGSCNIAATSETIDSPAVPVTVAAAPTSTTHPNEPSSMTAISEVDFASVSELVTAGWTGTSDAQFACVAPATDSMASQFTRSTTTTGRAEYPAGFAGGGGPINVAKAFSGSASTLYLDFDFAVSSAWSGHSSGVGKILFLTAGTSAANPVYLSAQGVGSGTLTFQVRLQGAPPSKGGNSASGAQNISCGSLTRGTKTRIEIVMTMNSVDGSNNAVADGTLYVWRDGVLVLSRTNMAYRGNDAVGVGPTATWNSVKWNPTYGGTGGTVPAQQFQYIGYLYASRK